MKERIVSPVLEREDEEKGRESVRRADITVWTMGSFVQMHSTNWQLKHVETWQQQKKDVRVYYGCEHFHNRRIHELEDMQAP
jgi:alpha/beta superfamily hydrolase